ncbi:MAG: hypothetical protein HYS52_01540 [Candidatus Wildermuthbacteria bacterium]|nr:hypothetical protein [Candidatus Wildermuthbacteria bacterium]
MGQTIRAWLRKYFIPNPGNEYQPHILRDRAVVSILVAILALEGVFLLDVLYLLPDTDLLATLLPGVLADLTNSRRVEQQLNMLAVSPLLSNAAQQKANDMAQREYFAHVNPEGKTPWDWFQEAGYSFSYAGENLAINFVDSEELIESWMASPSHRDNILNRNFTEIGIGIARGNYKGQEVTFIAQFFARPFPSRVAGSAAETPATPPPEVRTHASFAGEVITTPKKTSLALFWAIAVFIILALALNIFIAIRIQHPALIARGFFMLLTAGIVIWFNWNFRSPGAAIFG